MLDATQRADDGHHKRVLCMVVVDDQVCVLS
jgi:hypothetical protein